MELMKSLWAWMSNGRLRVRQREDFSRLCPALLLIHLLSFLLCPLFFLHLDFSSFMYHTINLQMWPKFTETKKCKKRKFIIKKTTTFAFNLWVRIEWVWTWNELQHHTRSWIRITGIYRLAIQRNLTQSHKRGISFVLHQFCDKTLML